MSDLFASAVRMNGYPVISKQEFYQNQYLKKPRPVATLTDDMRGGYWVHNPDKSGWFVSPGGNPYFRYDAAGITQLNHKKTPIPAGDWLTECESAYFKQIYELEQQQLSKEDFKKHMDAIRHVLREAQRNAADGVISKAFVDQYIDKIFATPEDDGSMCLQIKLFTGETTDKYLQNLRSRTGHTFKKMIESYEKSL